MMAVRQYCRTISFPNLKRPNRQTTPSPPSKSYNVRSISLPCGRAHPLIPQLQDEITLLLSWWPQSKPIINPCLHRTDTTSSWLCNGLGHLKNVLDSLNHVLRLPLVRDSLSRSGVDKILDHFLRFIDVFGVFQTSLLDLKLELSSAQAAIRCKDNAKLVSYVKFHKKTAKEISKLLSTILRTVDGFPDQADEITTVIRDALGLITSVSAAVLESVLTSLGSTRRCASSWVDGLGVLKKLKRDQSDVGVEGAECGFEQVVGVEGCLRMRKKRGGGDEMEGALKRMQEMEEFIEGLEKGSGRVLRSLISTRVSLLNILTHS